LELKGVIPMEQEISNTKRQIDDIEWEGGHCEHLHKHLANLIDRILEGDIYYAPF
jgi:hypothetical protein